MKVVPGTSGYYWIVQPSKQLVQWLKTSVPNTHRYCDFTNNLGWALHQKYLVDAMKLEYYYGGDVDVSKLEEDERDLVLSQMGTWPREAVSSATRVKHSPYAVLHLAPTAPKHVVEAAWRAIAKELHPDTGGDEELFKKAQLAYHEIRKTW